ncbi:ABC transporter permease [Labrys wisconsinensis]|uniref:Polar amino acid transport system permease protein n=1 Tax=Labrys wisconsinensis TaxID=425677 RepID=A0ABU0J424_9HYPH|nr:ABC transporter permease subunit [Labrys wisconsinensis]MDQ0469010.1 polar amino acid transport system permease protein [Labrys wisconsinensis]
MATFLDLLAWGDTGWSRALVGGALVTIEISAIAFPIGILVGGAAAWAKMQGPAWLAALARGYTTICRSVPDLLLILLLYYAGQSLLNALLALLGFGDVGISGFAAATVVLGLVQGAYASEILRGSVLAIPRGQTEAARAYGFHGLSLFRRVTVPAIIPYALPGLANLWMVILKDSALISVVGTSELLFTARQAAGGTKYYLGFYLVAAALYYAITLLSNIGIRMIEARIGRWMPRSA